MSGTVDLAWTGSLSELTTSDRRRLLRRAPTEDSEARTVAQEILDRVRHDGDAALLELARSLDGADLESLEVPRAAWEEAWEAMEPGARDALTRARDNIRAFHAAQMPQPTRFEPEPGVVLERRVGPVERAGVYAPGGRASYPSSVLMGVVPARAAGVREVVVCSPPGQDGQVAPTVLAAAWVAEADRLFAVGGAGAVAAMALGTESIPPVDVLVGPGNRYVNEAKRLVAGTVRIDSPAGPSELLVLADEAASPARVAQEVVAQAEHDPDACSGVVLYGATQERARGAAQAMLEAIREEVEATPREEIVREALSRSGFLLWAVDEAEAVRFAEDYAPEHLAVLAAEPERIATLLTRSGTVFLGEASSVSFGDYLTGANHVLPTGGLTRSFSGLDLHHYLRSWTVQRVSPDAAGRMSSSTAALADAEGLPGHARAAHAAGALSSAITPGEVAS